MKARIPDYVQAVLLLMLGTGASLAGAPRDGRAVGRLHIEFAKQIARDGVPMTEELAQWLGDVTDSSDCGPYPEKVRGLDRARRKLLRLYIEKVCKPYMQLWEEGIAPCEDEPPAGWCNDEDGLSAHVDLEGYFTSITAGIRGAQSNIERNALMVAVIGTLSTHVMTEFPEASLLRWGGGAVSAFVHGASPEDVLRFGRQLKETWMPKSLEIAQVLRQYARTSIEVTPKQYDELIVLADELASE